MTSKRRDSRRRFASALAPVLLLVLLMFAGCASGPENPAPDEHPASDQYQPPAQTPDPNPAAPAQARARPPAQAPAANLARVEAILADMTLREQIAQRFITFVPRERPVDHFRKGLTRGPVGGIIIYPWNYTTLDELQAAILRLDGMTRRVSGDIGLFVSLDQEGGRVRALRSDEILQLPSAHNVGRHRDPELVEALAYANSRELKRIGFNMNLAPVLDLYPLADRTIIGDRSFGPEPGMVASLGEAYLRGSRRGEVIAVPKHFPGHGVTTVDSHGRLPVSYLTWPQLAGSHALPFRRAVSSGAEAIMTAHILFPEIDPEFPVTLSERFLREILREEFGFDGVIITDAIEMGAISQNYRTKEMLLQAFSGGIDIVLLHQNLNVWDLIETTEAMVRIGVLEEEVIVEGTRRVLLLKSRYGLLPER
ncbi:MAG: glycoside hydrolase family 3 protein [Spirochaetota bacterium]